MPLAVFADPKVVEGAKKEGELAWWSTIAQDQSQKIVDEFMKRYPFIKTNYWRSGSVGLHNKILIEARAGRSSWDVVSQTTPEFIYELKQKKLITAYSSPERSHFSTDLKDKDGYWTGTYALPTGLGINTQQVKKEDVPKSYKDLLDPRWKGGKISIDDENYELLVGLIEAWGKTAAVEYLKGLAAQAPVVGRGATQRTQMLAAGEFPLAISYTHTVEWSKSQGTSVDWVNLEPVVIKFDGITLGAKAAHPNAGKLFIDFVLSREGQELLQSFRRVTLRNGVDPDPPRLIKGFKRIVLHPARSQNAQEALKLTGKFLGCRSTAIDQKEEGVMNATRGSLRVMQILFLWSLVFPWALSAAPDPKVIEAAKKEGQLVWYNTLVQPHAKGVIDLFMKQYPFIDATFWRGGGTQVYSKLMIEGRAGRYDWDTVSLTNPEFVFDLKQRSIISSYKSPEREMFSEDLKDQEGYWTGYYALPTGLGFNTRMVKKDQVPKTYQDLLSPMWKGKKISVDTEGQEFLMGLIQSWGKEKAVDYLKKLAAQEPALGRGNNKRIELTAAGEFPLVIAFTHSIEANKAKGAPVDWVNLEPVVVQVDSIMLGARAPHPNAAKLFIDFVLSQQGQELLQSYRRPTLRNGVEPDPPRLIRGFKRVVLHPEKAQNAQESLKLYREILRLP